MSRLYYNADQSGSFFIKEPTWWVVPLEGRGGFDPLRVIPPPQSELYALATTIMLSAGAATADVWVWSNADVTADDDATVICPTAITHPAPGRWLKLVGSPM
jgi:hypothetical protein